MKKELDFEINILPILDILSVLICFLLLTAVWVQVGALSTQQAVGDNTISQQANPPSLWIGINKSGTLRFSLRDVPATTGAETTLSGNRDGVNWQALHAKIQALKTQFPTLKTVVIRPEATANYGVVIQLMDQLKQNQMTDVGLSPLG
jgi:biopolymer transport protein ExbD